MYVCYNIIITIHIYTYIFLIKMQMPFYILLLSVLSECLLQFYLASVLIERIIKMG